MKSKTKNMKLVSLLAVLSLAFVGAGTYSVAKVSAEALDTESELATALAAGGEVVLDGNVTISSMVTVPEGVTVTLDLNGYDITVVESTGNHIYALNNLGTLTLKDSVGTGSISARGIYNGFDTAIGSDFTQLHKTDAKIVFESGTYETLDTNGGAMLFNMGVAEVKGATFKTNYVAINNRLGGQLTIDGAYVDGMDYAWYPVQNNGGTVVIDDLTIEDGRTGYAQYQSTSKTTINDAYIAPNGYTNSSCHVLYIAAGEIEINGGEFIHSGNAADGGALTVGEASKVTITGGTFEAGGNHMNSAQIWYDTEVSVSGGEFGGNLILDSNNMTVTGGTFNVSESNADKIATFVPAGSESNVTTVSYIAEANGTGYATFEEALAAGDSVKLLRNTKVGTFTISGRNVEIDLNGKTLTLTTRVFMNSAVTQQ